MKSEFVIFKIQKDGSKDAIFSYMIPNDIEGQNRAYRLAENKLNELEKTGMKCSIKEIEINK